MRGILTTVQQSLALLNAGLHRRWWLQAPWALLSAGLEMVATTAMLLLIRVITDPVAASRMAAVATLRQWLGAAPGLAFNAAFAAGVAALYLLKNALRLAETYAQQRCAADTAVWLSSGLLERYLRAPFKFHLRRNSAEMMNNVGNAVDQVCWVVLQSATALVSEALVTLAILVVLVDQLPPLARAAAGITGGVTVLLLWATQRQHIRWGQILHRSGVERIQSLQQSFAALKEARLLGRERYFVARYARFRAALGRLEAVQQTTEVAPRLVVETTFVAALAALIVSAWLRPDSTGDITLTLGIFAYGGLRLLPSLHLVVYRFNRIGSGAAAVAAVAGDWYGLAPVPDVADPAPPIVLNHSIRFDAVSFTYEGGEPALRDIDLEIRRGEWIGIVGQTGAGKTTLVDLMLGILEPAAGAVRVDGRDIRQSLRSWQRQIAYVPQTVYLIDDTIRRNIALGLEDDEIDEARVLEAAGAAQLDDFLRGLPQGLDTVVGERGVKLSGGERQRISVARALYRRPAVLVFDEATAALDNATEQALTATVQGLHGNITRVFIAHRLSTVEACDRLVHLSHGRIV